MTTRSLAVLLALLLAGAASAAADVPQQTLDVRYDPIERTIHGTLEVVLPDAPPTVYFALIPNLYREPNPYLSDRSLDATYPFGFEAGGIDIESVDLAQSPSRTSLSARLLSLPPTLQTYSLEESVLAVDLPSIGDRTTIRIGFTTSAPRTSSGDDGVTDGVLTWRFGWYPLLLEDPAEIVEGPEAIAYGDERSFPFALPWAELEATVTAPSDLRFLSGADRVASISTDEEEDEVHAVEFVGPTRSFAISLGEGYEEYLLDGPIPIVVATFDGHDEEARLYATYARDVLSAYESRFGPYPRERLTIVESPTRGGSAFAADGIVWMSSLFFTHRNVPIAGVLNRFAEYVLAHEIAHQWFGLGVDLDTDAWLSEGLAQYASISHFENRYGPTDGNLFEVVAPGLLEDLVDSQFGFYNLREHQTELPYLFAVWSDFDEAIVKPLRDVEFANENVTRLYDKGYLVARTIAAWVGEETFDRALQSAFGTERGRRIDAAAFQRILEQESGRSLDEVFTAWVFGDARVDYTIEITARRRSEAGHETTAVVRRDGGIPQPVEVEATLASGATARQTWDGEETEATLVFRTPSPVSRVTVDPDHRLPDEDRLNNNDPVKIVTAVNRAILPLDAYVISPSPTTGGFSFSWLDRFRVSVRENSVSIAVNEGRNHSLSGAVSVAENRLTGQLAYTYTTYGTFETGSPATYWAPDVELTATVRRLLDGEDPLWTFSLSALDLPSIGDSQAAAVGVDIADGGAVRLSIQAFDEIRLVPNLYLQGVGMLGFGGGDLPAPMKFTFDELRSLPLDPTNNKLSGSISITLDTVEEPYNLLNLAMVDGRRTRLFLAGGLGWTSLREFGTTSPSVEAGIEQTLKLSTLGGLVPFEVRLAISTPVIGSGGTVLYVGISL